MRWSRGSASARRSPTPSTALAAAPGAAEEITADLLRAASEAIGRLSGRVDVEDVLDRLFREFCIGK